jgi:hypothetical protein
MTNAYPQFNIQAVQAQIAKIMQQNSLNVVVTIKQVTSPPKNLGLQTTGGFMGLGKKNVAYNHYVSWVTTKHGKFMAQTSPGTPTTEMDNTGTAKWALGQRGVIFADVFANILVHEVLYLGVLGEHDDNSAPIGSLECGWALKAGMLNIDPKWVKAIEKKLYKAKTVAAPQGASTGPTTGVILGPFIESWLEN